MENLLSNLLGGFVYETLIGVGIALFLLLSLAYGYVHLQREERTAGRDDPQLGLKIVLHYFFSVAYLLAATGAAMLVGDLLNPESETGSDMQRSAVALLVVGLAFAGLHYLLLWRGTNDTLLPRPGRFFTGWRLAVHGFVVLVAAAWLAMLLLQKTPKPFAARELLSWRQHTLYGILLVWGPSWVGHLMWYWWYVLQSRSASELTWETKD